MNKILGYICWTWNPNCIKLSYIYFEAVRLSRRALKAPKSNSLGGRFSLTIGRLTTRWLQLYRFGNFSLVSNCSPTTWCNIGSQKAIKTPTMSTNPNASPPKNFLSLSSFSRICRISHVSSTPFSRSFSSMVHAEFHTAYMH